MAGALSLFLIFRNRLGKISSTPINKSVESNNLTRIPEPEETKQNNTEELNNFKKTIDNLYIVNELGRKVTSSLNLQQTFQHLYSTINSMMDAAVIELRVYDEISSEIKTFSNIDFKEAAFINPMSDWCYKNNREVFLSNAEADFARYVFQPLQLPDGRIAKSIIVFPILKNNIVSGSLCIISFQKGSFEEYHREIIRLLLGYIAVAIDNAIRHEELNLTKIRAEKSEKFKEQFLANMSHEIRTPINAVSGMTGLLLEKQPREDQLRYLDSIRIASDSLLVIINDILDLSKIEAGKIELEQIDFSLRDLIRNLIEIMHFKAEEKGLILENQIEDNIPNVLVGDPTRLTQILINLLGNAIKFTSKGTVKIKVLSSPINQGFTERLSHDDGKVSIRFEVSDTGIGMTTDQQIKLFQNYAQASSETSRKFGGTGLGLSISKNLLELLGGNIEVKSEHGKGSTFSFTIAFPVSKNKFISVKEKRISKEMLQELKGIKVLLADDNEYNRIVVKETLQLKIENVLVDEALDGSKAVEMLKRNEYDIVLMDLVMPFMDGFEATKIIREDLPTPKNKIKIIALTASVVKREIDNCYAVGMNGFIPKPFKNYELLGAIYKAFNSQAEPIFYEVSVEAKAFAPTGKYTDLNYLYEFTEGDKDRIKRYVDIFLTKTPVNIVNIKKFFEIKDYENVRISVHSMKPHMQALGIKEGVELAETIEEQCREKSNPDNFSILIDDMSNICEKAMKEIKELEMEF